MTALVTLTAFLLTLIAPTVRSAYADDGSGPPPPGDELVQAQQHFQAGKQAFDAGDYQSAIREFKAAQAIKASAKLDYNIGISYERLNRPRAAIKYYRSYLAGMPGAPNRAEVEQKVAALEQQAAAQPAPTQPGNEEQVQPPPPNGNPQYSYNNNQPPVAVQPVAAPRKKSYWWIIFPILGGATVVLLITLFVLSAASYSAVYYSNVPPSHVGFEPSVLRPTNNPTGAQPGGMTLFRF